MIKMAVAVNGDKQIYSDTPGSHGRAEMLAFMVDYVSEVNEMAGMYMIKEVKDRNLFYIDLFGKWKDTVDQKLVDKFNEAVKNDKGI